MSERPVCPKIEVTEREAQYRREKYTNLEDVLKESLKCTACNTDLSGEISVRYSCHRHVVLQVLVCKKCQDFYGSGHLQTEEDGSAKYCRWCGDGGILLLCDNCDSGFCKSCLRRNLSRSYFHKIVKMESSEKWSCFVCVPDVLYDLRATAWAAQKLCKKRRKEEKGKESKRKKGHRKKDESTMESPDAENSNPAVPTDLANVNTERRRTVYKNPVLEQSKLELKNYFSQLISLQNSERFRQIESEINSDCDSFSDIERLELMMQDHVIGLIEDANRFSTDLSTRVGQLQRLYLIAEDEARENGGECIRPNDTEHNDTEHDRFENVAKVETENDQFVKVVKIGNVFEDSDQDDVISLSSKFSDDSHFSSVSTSRHNVENRCENDGNLEDDGETTTGFSLANLGATSTPSKPVEFIKMEVERSPREEGEEDGDEIDEDMKTTMKEDKEGGVDQTLSLNDYALKLLEEFGDSDDLEEEEEGGMGEDSMESEEEGETEIRLGEDSLEEEDGLDLQLGEASVESEEDEEGMEERLGKESAKKEEDRKKIEEEEVGNDENKDVNSMDEIGRRREVDEENEREIKKTENSESLDVKDCKDPTDEKNTETSDEETDFSQNVEAKKDEKKTASSEDETDFSQRTEAVTTVVENRNSGANSDASTDFEIVKTDFDSENLAGKKKKKKTSDNSDKSDGETTPKHNEKDSQPKTDDEWDEINRLANFVALDRDRKKRSFSPTSEDNASEKSDERSPKKKAKKKEEKYDILDNLNDSQEEDNVDTDDSFEDAFELGRKSMMEISRVTGLDCNSFFSDYDKNSSGSESCGNNSAKKMEDDEEETKEKSDEDKETEEKSDEDKDAKDETDEAEKTTDSTDSFQIKMSPRKRPSWKRDGLLTGKLSSSDEDDKKEAAERRRERREKKKERRKEERPMFRLSISSDLSGDPSDDDDSDDDDDDDDCRMVSNSGSDSSIQFVMTKSKRIRKSSSSGSIHSISSIDDNDDVFRTKKRKNKIWPRKKRIKINLDDSSENGSSCEEVDNYMNTSSQSTQGMSGGRRNIRKVMKDEDVALATKKAIKEEEKRKKRVLDRQQKFNDSFGISDGSAPIVENRLVLDFDTETKKELICVDENLVARMKTHQVEGVKFMWDACFESLEAIKDGEGGGCILAHCMGLGKTFQVISLVHTLLMHRNETNVRRVLICCPLTTVLNWYSEFKKWMSNLPLTKQVALHHLANDKTIKRRVSRLESWHQNGGVMIIGYEMFRSLTNEDKKLVHSNYKAIFAKTLLKPGADLVICDEGHTLKNLKTALSKQMNKIHTKRRIVLTGTPLQNNLIEYHCMMNFVKPNYLGTKTEFINRFVNPITNGQFVNSTPHDYKVMKRRAHVLHKMLDGITQRRDYSVLTPYLPAKQEYVISIRLTELQIKLMKTFLEQVIVQKKLFKDYQSMSRLWSHPLTLRFSKSRKKRENDGKLPDIETAFNENSNDSDVQIVTNGVTVAENGTDNKKEDEEKAKEGGGGGGGVAENGDKEKEDEWWEKLVTEEQMNDITVSSKLVMLFEFLKQCVTIGDKVLIFSQKLASLDVMEYFLEKWDQCDSSDKENVLGSRAWKKGVDYFRLDGSTSSDLREKWTKAFNNPTNRSRLFLISTRAGGMGINLTAANRVILFDASWNPSHDIQSIFRVFRFGQDKPCYIYRFIAQGTMEEKIYERQISKLSLSIRVVDEQQVNRHFTQSDLQELYKFTPASPSDKPVLMVPKDRVLCEMLEEHSALIYKVFEHDSLLNHVQEEELDEEEQRAAWEEYKNEKNKALTIDRIQSVQSIPAVDLEMLMTNTLPAQDVEIMERMLMQKYGQKIPPEKLKEILNKEVDLWKRNRIAQLTGAATAGGPAPSRSTTTRPSSSSTPVLTSNQHTYSRPPTSSKVATTSLATMYNNMPSTSRPISTATPTSWATKYNSMPSTSRPVSSATSTRRPMSAALSTSRPTSMAPSTSRPISMAPSTSRPISIDLSTSRPLNTAPLASRPISMAPSTSRPMSSATSTSRPMSMAPSTSRPMSSAPSTSRHMSSATSTSRPMSMTPSTSRPMSTATSTSRPMSSVPSTSRPMSTATSSSRPMSTAPLTSRSMSTATSTSRPMSTDPSTSRPMSTALSSSRPMSMDLSTSRPTTNALSNNPPLNEMPASERIPL